VQLGNGAEVTHIGIKLSRETAYRNPMTNFDHFVARISAVCTTADHDRCGDRNLTGPSRVILAQKPRERTMDHDRIKGAANQAKGQMKDTAGKLTGDAKLQAEGKADKMKGKVQNAVGGAKDAIRQNKDD
jgi:uncharacterized protein YjbJ (UPF0337 family)